MRFNLMYFWTPHHKLDHVYTQLVSHLFPFDFDHFRHVLIRNRNNGSNTTTTPQSVVAGVMPECWTRIPQDVRSIIESYLYTLRVVVGHQWSPTRNGKWARAAYITCDVDLFSAILRHPLIRDCERMMLPDSGFLFSCGGETPTHTEHTVTHTHTNQGCFVLCVLFFFSFIYPKTNN